jgi:hypothetical protein
MITPAAEYIVATYADRYDRGKEKGKTILNLVTHIIQDVFRRIVFRGVLTILHMIDSSNIFILRSKSIYYLKR